MFELLIAAGTNVLFASGCGLVTYLATGAILRAAAVDRFKAMVRQDRINTVTQTIASAHAILDLNRTNHYDTKTKKAIHEFLEDVESGAVEALQEMEIR